MPGRRIWEGRKGVYKYIEIDISKQRLYAYKGGRKVREIPISSGIARYSTPIGDFAVRSKLRSTRMKHEYGPNHPDNYDIPNVPHTMYFTGPYALHGAFWHNNFGHPMSHGCVNLPLHEAAWLFNWADVGDKVFVRQ
ncbi:L,D-transpeptidase [Patescibacteria group bacterium]|nr:L,D-transpeptidase [Patescibacteria group bacterium]